MTSAEWDEQELRKDEALDQLAERINVAQFVAYAPTPQGPEQTFSRVRGHSPNTHFPDLRAAAEELLRRGADRAVNLRSYLPQDPRSKPFHYGLDRLDDIVQVAEDALADGFFVILNETVDVNDGGVSGVVEGGIVEFAPDDTPRCVEKPGTASLPLDWARQVLALVYGFDPELPVGAGERLEFSLHPQPRGWRGTQTLGWEVEEVGAHALTPRLAWPNRFSRLIGDKAYGLLMAHLAGARVPLTSVFARRLPGRPFSFGAQTGGRDVWVRTCPIEPVPGRYATHHGWVEPFALLQAEDPEPREWTDPDLHLSDLRHILASAVVQAGVPAAWSGAYYVDAEGRGLAEGVAGAGDAFMLGAQAPQELPAGLRGEIEREAARLAEVFGPVRFEWVHDGEALWVVQLHRGRTASQGAVIVPGAAARWERFEVAEGLGALRARLEKLPPDCGLEVVGRVGLTSHVADVLRRAGVPARLV
ncbi:unnamed protein product [Symbiodinium necroappetens]|uniref:Uncharacterized protein n=1 Tax=Symbiodinium necroappetens TaxID=1628268 RepID=A0A812P6B2_9DINO|nr:unnamed protein product [Symbiodinium necroappetens]